MTANEGFKEEYLRLIHIKQAICIGYELTGGNNLLVRNQFVECLWPILFDPVNVQNDKCVLKLKQTAITIAIE